jgi:hypothetical protein
MRNTKTWGSRNLPKHELRLYVTLDLFWSISQALFNHISTIFTNLIFATLDLFWSISQSHLCKEGHVHAFLLTMQLWIYSEAFLKHFSITSLHRRTCTCLYISYAALDLFWSISEALSNHISAKKDKCMSFYWLATLDLFWSISEALFNHVSEKKDMYMPLY